MTDFKLKDKELIMKDRFQIENPEMTMLFLIKATALYDIKPPQNI